MNTSDHAHRTHGTNTAASVRARPTQSTRGFELEETWRLAPQLVGVRCLCAIAAIPHPIDGGCRMWYRKGISLRLSEDRSGILLAVEGRQMGDESADQGGQRSESQSGVDRRSLLPIRDGMAEPANRRGSRISCRRNRRTRARQRGLTSWCNWLASTSNGVGRQPPCLPKRNRSLGKKLAPMRPAAAFRFPYGHGWRTTLPAIRCSAPSNNSPLT